MSRLGHLTEQRKQFVEAYCRLGNGTLAAREAGYKTLAGFLQNHQSSPKGSCKGHPKPLI